MVSNDSEFIYENSIENMNELHEAERVYINEALIRAKEEQKEVIMITHYLPSYQLNHPKYAKYVNHFHCFSSHSDDLIRDPVKLWIFGHTHAMVEKEISGILCVANPIGYKGENLNVNFTKCVSIE
jgi:predicted phosphodiesterase